jgi:adenine-specific DNA-methyltransferase
MQPYYEHNGITIYHGDCREVLPGLTGVHLIVADPPYNGVLPDDWDNQWANDAEFLVWLDGTLAHLASAAMDNATLYLFSSPRLAARVELQAATQFAVIGSVVWDKNGGRNGAGGSGIDVTSLRTYWHANTERVLVAEQLTNRAYRQADDKAKEASGFWAACETGRRSVIGEYLRGEFAHAGVTNKQIAALFPSRTGGLTGCVSNWLLGFNIPTAEQYATMRAFLNDLGGEYLRREYEDLRREYEDLRRPFFLTTNDQWGDVWRFRIPRSREHPAQKPLAMMNQIVRVSSRLGDLVLDPFMGSGTTLQAAKDLGRRAIGIEIEERYCEIAARRLEQEVLDFGDGAPCAPPAAP